MLKNIPLSRAVSCLGLLGLAPFIVLAACLWFVAPVWQDSFARALVAWGAIILGFTGAVHWGAAFYGAGAEGPMLRCAYGACPAIAGWTALLCPPATGLFLLFAGFVAAFIVDRRVWQRHEWYVNLRALLSVLACACLYAGYKALP